MYWNQMMYLVTSSMKTININMRCIEIAQLLLTVRFLPGLTLTWDVLKSHMAGALSICLFWLTLTWDVLKFLTMASWKPVGWRLTLTWDVLKWVLLFRDVVRHSWLTLTWDVLKCECLCCVWKFDRININMRCIEICELHRQWHLGNTININMRCIEIILALGVLSFYLQD